MGGSRGVGGGWTGGGGTVTCAMNYRAAKHHGRGKLSSVDVNSERMEAKRDVAPVVDAALQEDAPLQAVVRVPFRGRCARCALDTGKHKERSS